MADEKKATFAVQLKDETSAPAKDAANAFEQLRAKIAEETAAMRGAQSAMARLKSAGLQTSGAAATLRKQIEAHKLVIGQAEAKFVKLGGSFRATAKAATDVAKPVEDAKLNMSAFFARTSSEAADAAKEAGAARAGFAPLTGSFDGWAKSASEAAKPVQKVKEEVTALAKPTGDAAKKAEEAAGGSSLLRTAMAGVAGIAVVVATAIAAAAVSVARYALSVADARRSELLHIQGLLALRRAHGYATTSANDVQNAIDRVADSTALGRNELSNYAMQIARSGVRGDQLNSILETTAMVASAAGDSAAQSFREQATWAARTGQSVEGLAQRWRNRFGAIATAQTLSFDRQMTRLHENISQLFSGLNIDGFLNGFHRIVSIFSQSQESGRALKTLLNGLFGPLLGQTEGWGRALENVIKRGIVFALRIHIAFMRFQLGIRQTWLYTTRFGLLIRNIGGVIADIPRLVLGVVGSVFRFLGDIVGGLFSGIADFAHWIDGLVDVFRNGSWSNIGRFIVDGIINGLSAAAHGLVNAVGDLAHSVMSTFRDFLGIHSPSRVFANLGLQIPRGVEQGIERGRRSANAAAADLVEPPEPSGTAGGGGGRQQARVAIQFGDIHVHMDGSDREAPRRAAAEFIDELASLLEGVGIQIGAATS